MCIRTFNKLKYLYSQNHDVRGIFKNKQYFISEREISYEQDDMKFQLSFIYPGSTNNRFCYIEEYNRYNVFKEKSYFKFLGSWGSEDV